MMKKVIGILVGIVMPLLSVAHGYWLEIEGSGKIGDTVRVKVYFGEIDDNKVRHREADTARFTMVVSGPSEWDLQSLELQQKDNYWEAAFIPQVAGAYHVYAFHTTLPVVDRSAIGGKNVKPQEFLCAAYQAGIARDMEQLTPWPSIRVKNEGKQVRITTINKKKPMPAGTKIRIFHPDNADEYLTTDDKGTAVFTPEKEGLYIIRYDYVETTPGTYQGVPYVEVRNRCNFSYYKKRG